MLSLKDNCGNYLIASVLVSSECAHEAIYLFIIIIIIIIILFF